MAAQWDCVIIGAGAAGLAAGAMLHEAGRSFVILEARDRIGGRAQSVPLSDGSMAERGAQYVHGARLATWEYIARHGLTTHAIAAPTRPVTRSGCTPRRHLDAAGEGPIRRAA
jgi:monoamine oxidase